MPRHAAPANENAAGGKTDRGKARDAGQRRSGPAPQQERNEPAGVLRDDPGCDAFDDFRQRGHSGSSRQERNEPAGVLRDDRDCEVFDQIRKRQPDPTDGR